MNVALTPSPSASVSPPSPYTSYSASAMNSPLVGSMPNSPILNHASRASMSRRAIPGQFENPSVDSFASQNSGSGSPMSPSIGIQPPSATLQASKLAREKNRLTLRSYLHALLSSEVFASSPVLRSFLLSGPTRLTCVFITAVPSLCAFTDFRASEEEREDARRREEADRMREDGRKRFAKEIKDRVEGLREAVRSVKGELLGKGMCNILFVMILCSAVFVDGLTHVFSTIKHTPDIKSLPDNYKAVMEWARISYVVI